MDRLPSTGVSSWRFDRRRIPRDCRMSWNEGRVRSHRAAAWLLSLPPEPRPAPPRPSLARQDSGPPDGTIGILHECPHLARLACFRVRPEWRQTAVLTRLMDQAHHYCWSQGYLKLVVPSHVAPFVVQQMLNHRGFQLVRPKRSGQTERLEYLVHLYYVPRRASSAPSGAAPRFRDPAAAFQAGASASIIAVSPWDAGRSWDVWDVWDL